MVQTGQTACKHRSDRSVRPMPILVVNTHLLLVKASATYCLLRTLGGTHAKTAGARFSTEQPCSHLSDQNRVLCPFPTSVLTAMANNARELGWEGSSRSVQGRSVRVLLCHCH